MTTGIVLPAQGMTAATFEEAQQRDQERAAQRGTWHQLGREALGLVQSMRDGSWSQRSAEQVRGLPSPLVEQARAAVQTEQRTRAELEAKTKEATAYISKHGLNPEAARVHFELHRAEAYTDYAAAERDAIRACMQLGEVVEQVNADRQTINRAPELLAQIDAAAARQKQAIQMQVEAARVRLLRNGASE